MSDIDPQVLAGLTLKAEKEIRAVQRHLRANGIRISRSNAMELIAVQKAAANAREQKIADAVVTAQPSWMKEGGLSAGLIADAKQDDYQPPKKSASKEPVTVPRIYRGAGEDPGAVVTEVVFISGALYTENVLTDGSDPVPIT